MTPHPSPLRRRRPHRGIPTSAARADRTADDKQAIVIRVNANATGTDTFIYRKNNVNYTVDIIYAEPGPVTRSDIYVFDTTQDQLRFNPLLNDEIQGLDSPNRFGQFSA